MTRMALNKSTLHRENSRLKMFKKFLPSLDLKRRQLLAAQAKMRRRREGLVTDLAACRQAVRDHLPMLAELHGYARDLVRLRRVRLGRENLVGVKLPTLLEADLDVASYPLLSKPHWVDHLAVRLKDALRVKLELEIQDRRLKLIDEAVRRTTQRLNLFEKVLIPRTKENIKKIAIFLSDLERAGVVRAKIAKSKHKREARV